MVAFAIALGFAVVPPGRPINPAEGLRKGMRTARAATAKARVVAALEGNRETNRTWGLGPEAIGVRVMDTVDRVAVARGVQVANFTVGRPIVSAGLRQMPFTVTLNGAFPQVAAAMAELERPEQKLAIGGVKIVPGPAAAPASSPGEILPGLKDAPKPQRVTATVTLTAFLRGEGG